jgi:hypothetical protein
VEEREPEGWAFKREDAQGRRGGEGRRRCRAVSAVVGARTKQGEGGVRAPPRRVAIEGIRQRLNGNLRWGCRANGKSEDWT